MARGSRTPPTKEQEFLKSYLRTHNVSRSAEECGIPTSTGFEIVHRLKANKRVAKAREATHARLLDEALDRVVHVNDALHARIVEKPKRRAKNRPVHDRTPDYAQAFFAGVKTLHAHVKLFDEDEGDKGPVLVINLAQPAEPPKAEPSAA